jgi:ribosomal protein S18 acetylase RimI-like enzyme
MHELRLLNEHDASQFWQFRLTGLEECPQAFTESADELQSSPVDVTVQRLRASSEDNFVLGAFGDGRLIGTVGFVRNQGVKTNHKGRIWGVYVDPAFRRQGIAGDMIMAVLGRIRRAGSVHQVSLTVATTQVAAMTLYDSLAFTTFGVEPHSLHVGDNYVDEEHRVLMLDFASRTMPTMDRP